jgi:peroxiredoxin
VADLTKHLIRAFSLGLVLLLIVAGCSTSRTASAQSVKPTKDRKVAPDFVLKDASGKQVKLSDYRGKAVVLDFWATWCGPCKVEIPWFVEFQRKYKDRGLVILGVASGDEGWDIVKPFATQMKINYPILLGNDATADLYGGIEALPTTFIIDRDGRVAKLHIGLASKEDFQNAIEKVLDAAPESQRTSAGRTE